MKSRFCSSINPCVAILWDFQNNRANQAQIQALLAFAFLHGEVVFKRAYADWPHENRLLQEKLDCEGFELISVPSSKKKPNRTDQRLIQDCRKQILGHSDINKVILLSKDGDFTPSVSDLKAEGKTVIVIIDNPAKTSQGLKAAASEFYSFSQIEQWFSSLKFAA